MLKGVQVVEVVICLLLPRWDMWGAHGWLPEIPAVFHTYVLIKGVRSCVRIRTEVRNRYLRACTYVQAVTCTDMQVATAVVSAHPFPRLGPP